MTYPARRLAVLSLVWLMATFGVVGFTAMRAGDQPGADQGYVAGDGSVIELPAGKRGDPVVVSGTDSAGKPVSSADFAGKVVVVNLWYAACGPCRDEAPDLAAIAGEYPDTVAFLGVNTRDDADTAAAFEATFSIPYPSIVDSSGAAVLALRGVAPPNAVPTTLVLDASGRVSARISGRVDPSTLRALIDSAATETP
jgi:thiol-disulfide isomerase/thioredoxin